MSKKSFKPQFVIGTMVPGIFMYNSCCENKKKKNRNKIKKWIYREIEFNEKTSDLEKAKIINETERQIIETLYKQKSPELIIKSINFSLKPGVHAKYLLIKVTVVFMFYKEGTDTGTKDPKKPVG